MADKINKKEFRIARKVGLRKMIKSFASYFDQLCRPCKALVLRRPKDSHNLIKKCKTCRHLIKNIEDDLGVEQ